MVRSLLRRRHRDNDDGFSLIELIVAMVIIGVVLLLLVGVQISAAVSVTQARKLQQATAIANQAMEQMRSIPWNTLNRGLYSGYLTAAGGDDLVVAGELRIPNETAVKLRVATAGADQNPNSLARPLVNESGSNKYVVDDPSGTGVEFTVKAYVYEPSGVAVDGIVGLAVVVEWLGRRGVDRTTVWSEAYRGSGSGCSQDLDTQPFLAACQSYFDASSSSGNVVVGISAIDAGSAGAVTQPLLYPDGGSVYTLSMRTAKASASLRSQQVTYVDSLAEFGANTWDDSDPETDEVVSKGAVFTLTATNDGTNPDGDADQPSRTFTQSSTEDDNENSVGGSPLEFTTRSDYLRAATQMASTTTSCLAGIPAGQPCARTYIGNNYANQLTGSGYLLFSFNDGQIIRMSRRLSDATGSATAGNTDEAWVARFATSQGSTATGCTSITGSGCVAAGASRTNAVLSIGVIIGHPWNEGASSGMVYITNTPGYGDYYRDSVKVERGAGASQKTAVPTVVRNGRLNYWTGTSYTPLDFTEDTTAVVNTEPVTWDHAGYTVTATTEVQISPKVIATTAPADGKCEAEACTVRASAGTIVIVSTYLIETATPSDARYLVVTTQVNGASASASYKAAPSG